MNKTGRLPDFIVVGAAKSGTTTLYQWLCDQPEVYASSKKEPAFFSKRWELGFDWYEGIFAGALDAELVGEASPSYTDAAYSAIAAERMYQAIPDVRLIYILRHPVARMRSYYRYRRRRGLVSIPFRDAISQPGNPFVGQSLYYMRLLPYIERFPRKNICIVRFEDLVSTEGAAWPTVLAHLGLPARSAPNTVYNVTELQPVVGVTYRCLRSLQVPRLLRAVPKPVKRSARAALTRSGPQRDKLLRSADQPIASDVLAVVWSDIRRLEHWLGCDHPLWPRGHEGS